VQPIGAAPLLRPAQHEPFAVGAFLFAAARSIVSLTSGSSFFNGRPHECGRPHEVDDRRRAGSRIHSDRAICVRRLAIGRKQGLTVAESVHCCSTSAPASADAHGVGPLSSSTLAVTV
jgi:hypothetical protein